MKVIFTPGAEQNLERIADYIAQDNPVRAVSFIRELREKAMGLSAMPKAFPLVPSFERFGIRRRVHGKYLIFYTERQDGIYILLVAHGAQDYDRLLIPED